MEVYVEYVIIDNLIINYLLLSSSIVVSRVRTTFLRKLLSAIVGTIVAVVLPLFKIDSIYLIVIKILLSLLMVILSLKFTSFKGYLKTYFFFLLFTFLCGGCLIALFYFANIDYQVYFSLNYDSFMPIGISILIVFVLSKITVSLVKRLLLDRDVLPFIRKCEVFLRKNKIVVNGYIDSGNRLFESKTGLPIIVASCTFMDKLKSTSNILSFTSIKMQTVGGEFEMEVYLIDKLKIYNGVNVNTYNNVLIGKSNTNFYSDGEYDLLLHPSLF